MGIKDLYQAINATCPHVMRNISLSDLHSKRVAVDISIFFYKFVRTAGEKYWVKEFVKLMCVLKKNGIKAVCIFDGPNPPKEKQEEQDRRRAETQKQVTKLHACKRLLKTVKKYMPHQEDPIDLPASIISEAEELLLNRRAKVDTVNYSDAYDVADALKSMIYKLERQTLAITSEHKKVAQEIIEIMGLPHLTSDGEAETLCSYLAVRGLVDAVLTEDTDVLAYGTPLFIAKLDIDRETARVIEHTELMEGMGLDYLSFRDLCIMLSCDYNKRIKGYPPDGKSRKKPCCIGMKGALAMIQEHKSIEDAADYIVDLEPLNHRRCRKLFTVPSYVPFAVVPFNRAIDKKRLIKFVNKHRVSIHIDTIMECWRPVKIEFVE